MDYRHLENSPKKARALIGEKSCLYKLDGDTELARAVDVMMARARRIYILIIKVVFLFLVAVFSKRNRKHVLCVSIEL